MSTRLVTVVYLVVSPYPPYIPLTLYPPFPPQTALRAHLALPSALGAEKEKKVVATFLPIRATRISSNFVACKLRLDPVEKPFFKAGRGLDCPTIIMSHRCHICFPPLRGNNKYITSSIYIERVGNEGFRAWMVRHLHVVSGVYERVGKWPYMSSTLVLHLSRTKSSLMKYGINAT